MKWVVKIGGSLHDSPKLARAVRRVSDFDLPALIVPGGGPFADQVRASQKRWQFDDRRAHAMALLGMRQYGLLLAALGGDRTTARAEVPASGVKVWLPAENSLGDALAANWDLTSDSIAAWLACKVGADWLVLVKPISPGTSQKPLELVDASFAGIAAGNNQRCAMVGIDRWIAADFTCEEHRFLPT